MTGPQATTRLFSMSEGQRHGGGQGAGQVIVLFADGTREVVDIGFGRTN